MKKLGIIMAAGVLFGWIASSAQAHMLWLNASNYSPKQGETIWIEIGWGHKSYPRDEAMKENWLERIYALTPDGREVAIEKIFPAFYRFAPETRGTYQIIAKLRPGFLSITTDGHKLGSKKEVTNVVSCFKYIMNAKALIKVGGRKDGFSRTNAEPLEILPLKDPAGLNVGDILPVKIMFQDKHLAKVKLQATHAGRAADADKDHLWVQEKQSDYQGLVRMKLVSKGQWMFKISYKAPYPDTAEADEYSYSTSLTIAL